MKMSCKIVEDMLPMYHDKVCSEETALLVEEHIRQCCHCEQILFKLRDDIVTKENKIDDSLPLRKIRKSYQKLRLGWLIAIVSILVLVPIAFMYGSHLNTHSGYTVEYTKEEALADANEFMSCLTKGDYNKAYSYWDLSGEKMDLIEGGAFEEADLIHFEEDGLRKFCQGGETLASMGGISAFEFVAISDAGYFNRYGTEQYSVSYKLIFQGKDEPFTVSITKYGISHIGGGNGLIRHPLSYLTLWVQWVVDDYNGQYYDFESGQWIEKPKKE